jgi:hypothetical protein
VLDLIPALSGRDALRVLCIGAHCDDIEIGCGGTLLALQELRVVDRIDWVVLSGAEARRRETEHAMRLLVSDKARDQLAFGDFTDGSMPGVQGDQGLLRVAQGDTGTGSDPHPSPRRSSPGPSHRERDDLEHVSGSPDPRVRGPQVGWGPRPAQCVRADRARTRGAEDLRIVAGIHSQAGRDWFTRDTFEAMLRLRGIECRAESGWAEAFHARKLRLSAHLPPTS